jgi:hypothetical protein
MAENRRRQGLSKKKLRNMDDPTSIGLAAWCMRPIKAITQRLLPANATVQCHFCGSEGRLVAQFPRRGYG